MCFLILEHEQRPMKIRGEQVIAATIIPLVSEAVSAGLYIGARSGHVLEVKHVGLLADAVPAARPAYAAMRPIGVTLSKAGAEAEVDDVYVPLEQSQIVHELHGNLPASSNWPIELSDCWLPAIVEVGHEQAAGWFRVKSEQDVEALLVKTLTDRAKIATIKPRYAVNLALCVTNIERVNEWNTGLRASHSILPKHVVTV